MSFFISNYSDALFFTSWTAVAAFQTTKAIIDAWKWWEKFRRPATDYERVINGETRRGWHVAIPADKLSTEEYYPFDLWTTSLDNQSDLMTPPSSSIVFRCENPLPSGNVIHRIRRVSLIQPNASSTLLKIICDPKKWVWDDCRYLTSRNLMAAFRRIDRPESRIFLIDAFQKSYRALAVIPPEEHRYLSFAYLEKTSTNLRLRLVWATFTNTPNEIGNRLEFTDAAYDLPEGNSAAPVNPSSIESILFPVGINHIYYSLWSGIPVTAIPFNKLPNQDQNTNNIFCLTFDHGKKWKRETLTRWLAEFGKSETGKRIRNAVQSFLQLPSPDDFDWLQIEAIKEFNQIFTVPKSDALFAMTNFGGILKRWIRPPSLQRTAAEHLFRANPGLKMSDVEKLTGIEISDGILEDKEECETVIL